MAAAAASLSTIYDRDLGLRKPQMAIYKDPHRNKVVVAGSRFGKSYLALTTLILEGFRFPRSRGWYIGPTREMGKDIAWGKLKMLLGLTAEENDEESDEGSPLVRDVRESRLRITLSNGSTIQLMTALEPDRLRGRAIKTVVLDEFAMMGPEIWPAIRPRIGDKSLRQQYGELGRVLVIGCVDGETMVLPQAGMRRIRSYSIGSSEKTLDKLDENFYGLHHAFHRANGFWNNGTVETRAIKTSSGFELEASLRHPILVMSEAGITDWKRMSDIRPGDHVAIARGMDVWGNIDPVSGWDEYILRWRERFVGKTGPRSAPFCAETMTKDLAYFLGLWTAEGSIEKAIGRITITCGDNVGESLGLLVKHGVRFAQQRTRRDQWRANSYELVEFMRYIGTPLTTAPNKHIPAWVFRGRREWAEAFIAGMWDGDGFCDSKHNRVGYCSASARLAREVQLLLSNMGVIGSRSSQVTSPTRRVKKSSVRNVVEVSGESVNVFRDSISLRIERKAALLLAMECPYSKRDGVPHQAELLRIVRNSLRHRCETRKSPRNSFVAALNDGGRITYRSLRWFIETHDSAAELPEYKRLADNLRDHYWWDTVKTVEFAEAETFDFTIPDTHSFWSNGFISHNTPSGHNHMKELYDDVSTGIRPEWKSWRFTSVEGGNIEAAEIEQAKLDMSERDWRQEYMATFESIEGRVYHAFLRDFYARGGGFNYGNLDESVHDLGGPILIGMDFNVNPMCAVLSSKVPMSRPFRVTQNNPSGLQYELHTWKEYRLENCNTDMMMKVIRADFPNRHLVVHPDPHVGRHTTSANVSVTDHTIIQSHKADVYIPKMRNNSDKYNCANGVLCNSFGYRRGLINPRTAPWLVKSLDNLLFVKNSNLPDKSSGFDHQCLVAGTLVMTPFGQMPIELVQVGDYVLARKGWTKVVWSGMTDDSAEVCDLLLADGRVLAGTGTHPVWVDDIGEYVPLDSLSSGTILRCLPSISSSLMASDSVAMQTATTMLPTYRIGEWERKRDYIGKFGSSTTDLFRLVSTFTTSVDMRAFLRTWNASAKPNTSYGMRQQDQNALDPVRTSNFCPLSGPCPQNGMRPTRAEPFTEGLPTKAGLAESQYRECANSVGAHTRRWLGDQSGSVLMRARQRSDAALGRTMSCGIASSAASSSQLIAIAIPEPVPVCVLRVSSRKQKQAVFDLTTEASEFYANGIPCHNSDAWGYSVLATFPLHTETVGVSTVSV